MGQKMLGVTSALKSMEALAKRLLATDVSGINGVNMRRRYRQRYFGTATLLYS